MIFLGSGISPIRFFLRIETAHVAFFSQRHITYALDTICRCPGLLCHVSHGHAGRDIFGREISHILSMLLVLCLAGSSHISRRQQPYREGRTFIISLYCYAFPFSLSLSMSLSSLRPARNSAAFSMAKPQVSSKALPSKVCLPPPLQTPYLLRRPFLQRTALSQEPVLPRKCLHL